MCVWLSVCVCVLYLVERVCVCVFVYMCLSYINFVPLSEISF
jgi:hypothetical protein